MHLTIRRLYEFTLLQMLISIDLLTAHRMLAKETSLCRSYQVRQASGYREFFRRHIIAQGSAYLYLHGAGLFLRSLHIRLVEIFFRCADSTVNLYTDGAPRDSAMFTLATSHTDPTLSKSTLELLLQTQDKINR